MKKLLIGFLVGLILNVALIFAFIYTQGRAKKPLDSSQLVEQKNSDITVIARGKILNPDPLKKEYAPRPNRIQAQTGDRRIIPKIAIEQTGVELGDEAGTSLRFFITASKQEWQKLIDTGVININILHCPLTNENEMCNPFAEKIMLTLVKAKIDKSTLEKKEIDLGTISFTAMWDLPKRCPAQGVAASGEINFTDDYLKKFPPEKFNFVLAVASPYVLAGIDARFEPKPYYYSAITLNGKTAKYSIPVSPEISVMKIFAPVLLACSKGQSADDCLAKADISEIYEYPSVEKYSSTRIIYEGLHYGECGVMNARAYAHWFDTPMAPPYELKPTRKGFSTSIIEGVLF